VNPVFLPEWNYDQNRLYSALTYNLLRPYTRGEHAWSPECHAFSHLGDRRTLHAASRALPNTFRTQSLRLQTNNPTKSGAIKASRHSGFSHPKVGRLDLSRSDKKTPYDYARARQCLTNKHVLPYRTGEPFLIDLHGDGSVLLWDPKGTGGSFPRR
jgi:hypothetical protein